MVRKFLYVVLGATLNLDCRGGDFFRGFLLRCSYVSTRHSEVSFFFLTSLFLARSRTSYSFLAYQFQYPCLN